MQRINGWDVCFPLAAAAFQWAIKTNEVLNS